MNKIVHWHMKNGSKMAEIKVKFSIYFNRYIRNVYIIRFTKSDIHIFRFPKIENLLLISGFVQAPLLARPEKCGIKFVVDFFNNSAYITDYFGWRIKYHVG